jgi:hypothetical protein
MVMIRIILQVLEAGQDILLPPNLPDLLDPAGNLVWTIKGLT